MKKYFHIFVAYGLSLWYFFFKRAKSKKNWGANKKKLPYILKGSLRIKKCHKKWKKFTIFLTPLPQDVLDFFEFGKNRKFDDPPPST